MASPSTIRFENSGDTTAQLAYSIYQLEKIGYYYPDNFVIALTTNKTGTYNFSRESFSSISLVCYPQFTVSAEFSQKYYYDYGCMNSGHYILYLGRDESGIPSPIEYTFYLKIFTTIFSRLYSFCIQPYTSYSYRINGTLSFTSNRESDIEASASIQSFEDRAFKGNNISISLADIPNYKFKLISSVPGTHFYDSLDMQYELHDYYGSETSDPVRIYYTIDGTGCGSKPQFLGNYSGTLAGQIYNVEPICRFEYLFKDNTTSKTSLYYYERGEMKMISKSEIMRINTSVGVYELYVKSQYCNYKGFYLCNGITGTITDCSISESMIPNECSGHKPTVTVTSSEEGKIKDDYNRSIILGLSISGGITIFIMIITILCCCCGCCD